ncbi:MAG TPA: ABC transporter permease [bacterium]|nr:ABC transporter permease [bacterium]
MSADAGTTAAVGTFAAARPARFRLPLGIVAGGLMLLALTGATVLAPVLLPADPNAQDLNAMLQPPSAAHPFGTDNYGRDVLTRVLYGAGIDLRIGVLAVVFPFVFGSLAGALAGYAGGWPETLVMRTVDVITAVPFTVLVIAIVAFLGPGETNILIAIGAVDWIIFARLVRGEVLREKNLEYVAALRAFGFGRWRIVFRHILPNAIAPAVTFLASDIVLVILTASALGFLGLGLRPPAPEWGLMIAEGRTFMYTAWWVATMPGFACMFAGIAFILVGDGLADLLRVRGQ